MARRCSRRPDLRAASRDRRRPSCRALQEVETCSTGMSHGEKVLSHHLLQERPSAWRTTLLPARNPPHADPCARPERLRALRTARGRSVDFPASFHSAPRDVARGARACGEDVVDPRDLPATSGTNPGLLHSFSVPGDPKTAPCRGTFPGSPEPAQGSRTGPRSRGSRGTARTT
jgi:hypothetical protein